ncbi:MAG: family 43 glycosylhydrolase [Paludibacteraceae bacterium]|nr:family 43 glycosylhydrolase [Paludibacteraceae bacterium]
MMLTVLCLTPSVAAGAAAVSYTNPILPYDYSDPDVCRVGDTYLMTSSSFNNVPGLQILASKDLLHWEIVDAAIRYRVPGYGEGEPLLGRMVWAPAIREHDGRIYIYYGDPDRGIYCIRSGQLPETGELRFPLEWEEAVLVMPAKGYIDPCPLWDEDGRVWLCHAMAGSRAGFKSVILVAELTADGLGVKTPSRIVSDGHEEHPTSEGPKLYKRNGYYYIMHPAGGVKEGWQVVQRSHTIYGPYELRVVLAQGKTAINGPHQGAWVETPEGESWFFHFQDVGVAGRLVHLQPVRWVDDWPLMGSSVSAPKQTCGEPLTHYGHPRRGERTWANMAHRDEFDQAQLGWDWQFAGGYIDPRWYFCHRAESLLRLYSFPRTEEMIPNMLLQKIPAVAFTATARVRFCPNPVESMRGAEQAGMVVFGRQSFTAEAPADGRWVQLRLQMDEHQRGQFYMGVERCLEHSKETKNSKKSKVESEVEHSHKNRGRAARVPGGSDVEDGLQHSPEVEWKAVGEPFQAVEGYWIGAQVGLFCTRDHRPINDGGWLDVDWFEITIQ